MPRTDRTGSFRRIRRSRSGSQPERLFLKGMLQGIPFLVFALGVVLLSVALFRHMRQEVALLEALVGNARVTGFSHGADLLEPRLLTPQPTPTPGESGVILVSAYETFPAVRYDERFAQLVLPTADIDVPVYEGDTETQYRKGAGHFSGSRFPGESGNVVLSAHRTTHFRTLGQAEVGDPVWLRTFYGDFRYEVERIVILPEKDDSMIQPDDGTERLTIYTCHPFLHVGHAPDRYYVVCRLVDGPRFVPGTGFVLDGAE